MTRMDSIREWAGLSVGEFISKVEERLVGIRPTLRSRKANSNNSVQF